MHKETNEEETEGLKREIEAPRQYEEETEQEYDEQTTREMEETEREMEERTREIEEAEKQEKMKEELKALARRIKENSGIVWDPKNLGCEICNGKVEQPQSFFEEPEVCDDCRELICRLADK